MNTGKGAAEVFCGTFFWKKWSRERKDTLQERAMKQELLSIGIDVGTSTTQVVFCSLCLKEETGYGRAPKVEIAEKRVLYRGRIWNTKLCADDEIDGNAVAEIVKKEYAEAGFSPENVHTGAVIITGESARKRNARGVIHALSDLAGEFVAMEAGPDLESVLAGRGAGADRLSVKTGKIVANVDIGGGTTNICLFQDGRVVDCACLNLGGRLLRVREQKIVRMENTMKILLEDMGISLKNGDILRTETAEKICRRMAELLEEAFGFRKKTELLEKITTNHGLAGRYKPELFTFSGGVADCFCGSSYFAYGDIGDLLGRAVAGQKKLMEKTVFQSHETIRATVIGAGSYSVEISGSTIDYRGRELPIRNLPVIRLTWENRRDADRLKEQIAEKKLLLPGENVTFAVSAKGNTETSFSEIEQVADILSEEKNLRAVVLERDLGKALGQALKRRSGSLKAPVCIDEIFCGDGDFIDIGKPVGEGNALQVVIKTLVFDQ